MTERLFSSTMRSFTIKGDVLIEENVRPITIDLMAVHGAYPALDDPDETVIEYAGGVAIVQCDYEAFLAAWRRFHQRHVLINQRS